MASSAPVALGQPIDRASHSPSPTINGSTLESPLENKSASMDKPAFALNNAVEKPAVSPYSGSGTQEDPYVVGWLPDEKEDPYNWTSVRIFSAFFEFFFSIATVVVVVVVFSPNQIASPSSSSVNGWLLQLPPSRPFASLSPRQRTLVLLANCVFTLGSARKSSFLESLCKFV